MNSPIPEDKLEQIKQALFERRKIDAIKLYRKYIGAGLAEAKSAVEKLGEDLRATSPDKFNASPERKGCMGLLIVAGVLAAMFVAWKFRI